MATSENGVVELDAFGIAEVDTYAIVEIDAVGLASFGLEAAGPVPTPPTYDGVPLIAAGSEPWPGGTVTMTPATATGADSEVYDWLLDDVSTGTDALTYTPVAGDATSALKPRQTATNGDGSTTVTGAAVTIEYLRGVARANATGSDYPEIVSQGEVPAAGTMLFEAITTAYDSSFGTYGTWMRPSTTPNRHGVALRINPSGTLYALIYTGGNAPVINLPGSFTVPGAYDGTTRTIVGVSWTAGGSLDVFAITPGGSVSATQISASCPSPAHTSPAVAVTVNEFPQALLTNSGLQSTVEAVGLSRAISAAERAAIATAGSLREWGAYSDGSLEWALYPNPATEEDGDTITTAAQLAGATWAITGDGTRMTSGGLNEATT